jgi:hypothetical protein
MIIDSVGPKDDSTLTITPNDDLYIIDCSNLKFKAESMPQPRKSRSNSKKDQSPQGSPIIGYINGQQPVKLILKSDYVTAYCKGCQVTTSYDFINI